MNCTHVPFMLKVLLSYIPLVRNILKLWIQKMAQAVDFLGSGFFVDGG